jgi:hypothetical protein
MVQRLCWIGAGVAPRPIRHLGGAGVGWGRARGREAYSEAGAEAEAGEAEAEAGAEAAEAGSALHSTASRQRRHGHETCNAMAMHFQTSMASHCTALGALDARGRYTLHSATLRRCRLTAHRHAPPTHEP